MPGQPKKIFKYIHMGIRIATIVDLCLIWLGSLVIFIASIIEVTNPNAGEHFPSPSMEHHGYNMEHTDCSKDGANPDFYSHRPLRFTYESLAEQNPRYFYCGWSSGLTWWRCLTSLGIMISSFLMLGILARRSPASNSAAIWQNPKRVLKFLMIPAIVQTALYFILIIADGSTVNKSRNWCQGKAETHNAIPDDPLGKMHCDYVPFVMIVLLDTTLALLCALLIGLIVIRNKKIFQRYMQLDEEDDFTLPMAARAAPASTKKKSKFSKFTRT